MSELYREAEELREQLLARESAAAADLREAHLAAWQAMDARLERLARERDAALARGETVDLAWLANRRLASVTSSAKQEFGAFAKSAAKLIEAEQEHAAEAGPEAARRLAEAAHREAGSETPFWGWQKADGKDLVGRSANGEPLRDRLGSYWPEVEAELDRQLKAAVAQGKDPREAIPHVRKAMGQTLARTLTTSCTEPLRVHRESARRAYAANPDLVERWQWTAFRQDRTCVVCLAMDGQEFPTSEALDGHPNCRCVMVPVVEGAAARETGEEWLQAQPEEVQQQVLGRAGQAAWAAGEVELADFVGRREDPRWGAIWYANRSQALRIRTKASRRDPSSSNETDDAPSTSEASNSAAAPTDTPKKGRKRKEKKAAKPRPAGTPVSQALQTERDPKFEPVHTALGLIDGVHGDGTLTSIPIKVRGKKGELGKFLHYIKPEPPEGQEVFDDEMEDDDDRPNEIGGKPIGIRILATGHHKELTTVHEIGHFLDYEGLGKPLEYSSGADPTMAEWRTAVEKSQAVQDLKELIQKGKVPITLDDGTKTDYTVDVEHVEYLLEWEELWARAYAQYITLRSGNVVLKRQLDRIRRGVGGNHQVYTAQHWADADFEPIAEAIDKIFEAKGWRTK